MQSATPPPPPSYSDYAWQDARDRGQFADLKEFTVKKSVVTEPMPSLLNAQDSIPIATIPVYDVHESFKERRDLNWVFRDRITLLGVSFRESGRSILQSWLEPFSLAFPADCKQYVELAIVEGTLHRVLVRNLFSRSVRQTLERARHPSLTTRHLFCFDDIIAQLTPLKIRNRLTGYVLLVDSSGRVRWTCSGEYCSDTKLDEFISALYKEQIQANAAAVKV